MAVDSINPLRNGPTALPESEPFLPVAAARALLELPPVRLALADSPFSIVPADPTDVAVDAPVSGFNRAAIMDTLARVLQRATPALDSQRMADAAVASLRGLAALDPELAVERDGPGVMLTHNGELLGAVRVPVNLGEWAHSAESATRVFRMASSRFAGASDTQLTDAFYRGLVQPLEGHASYRASNESRPVMEVATEGRVESAIVDGVGVLRIPNVSVMSGLEMRSVLTDWGLLGNGQPRVSGIVLDLTDAFGRENNAAAIIADDLLRRGVIYRTRGSDPAKDFRVLADAEGIPDTIPVVVLTNGATRGAAETLAQALQENRRGVVYGSSTLGDNLDYSRISVPGGGELELSTAKVLGPAGITSHGQGVTPQACAAPAAPEPAAQARTAARRAGQNSLGQTIPLRRFCPPSPSRAVVASPAFMPIDSVERDAWTRNAVALVRNPDRYRSMLERVESVPQPAPRSPWLFDRPGRS